MNSSVIKVSIYEDNKSLRDSLTKLIETMPGFDLVNAYPNAINIIEDTNSNTPDIILMDIGMPGINGIEAVKLLRTKFPDVKVIMQTVFDDDEKVFQSICAGAKGYILKKTPPLEILSAIREAYEGGAPMTPVIATKVLQLFRQHNVPKECENIDLSSREKEVLFALTNGSSYKMIASECSISIDTVRFHMKKIYEKLHVHSMTEAVSKALRDKLV